MGVVEDTVISQIHHSVVNAGGYLRGSNCAMISNREVASSSAKVTRGVASAGGHLRTYPSTVDDTSGWQQPSVQTVGAFKQCRIIQHARHGGRRSSKKAANSARPATPTPEGVAARHTGVRWSHLPRQSLGEPLDELAQRVRPGCEAQLANCRSISRPRPKSPKSRAAGSSAAACRGKATAETANLLPFGPKLDPEAPNAHGGQDEDKGLQPEVARGRATSPVLEQVNGDDHADCHEQGAGPPSLHRCLCVIRHKRR